MQPNQEVQRSKSSTCLQANMLKFVNQKNSAHRPQGKKCHPSQLFGVSSQSPDCFKGKNTLIAKYGYCYTNDKNLSKQNYEYYSQQHFVSLGVPSQQNPKMQRNFSQTFKNSSEKNKQAFHRMKGRLSEFMDKNGWMGDNFTIMGNQRSQSARQFGKIHRQQKIRESRARMTSKQKDMTSSAKTLSRPVTSHKDMTQLLMAEKMKIRNSRNQLASARLGSYKEQNEEENSSRPKSQLLSSSNRDKLEGKEKHFKINLIEWGETPFRLKDFEWNKNRASIDEQPEHKFNPPLPDKNLLLSQKKTSNSWMNSTSGSNKFLQISSTANQNWV